MTEKELKQLFYLDKETAQLQKQLKELKQFDGYNSPILSDIPKANRQRDRIADYVVELGELEELLDINLRRIQLERAKLERYISDIDDAEIRLIFRLRHVIGMTWEDIAAEMTILDNSGNIIKSQDRTTIMRKYKKFLNAHIAQ